MAEASWNGQHIQLVWFVNDVDGIAAGDIFQRIWKTEADQIQQNRVLSTSSPFLSQASSRDAGLARQVQVQPGRIDVVLSAEVDGDSEDELFRSLFEMPDSLTALIDAVEEDYFLDREVFRLSVVATLLKPVDTYDDGRADFIKTLGYDFAIANATDLMFQINSRKIIDGVNINRVVQIATTGLQTFFAVFEQGGVPTPTTTAAIRYASRRHFDFNTVPEGKALDRGLQITILKLLSSELLRVATAGTLVSLKA